MHSIFVKTFLRIEKRFRRKNIFPRKGGGLLTRWQILKINNQQKNKNFYKNPRICANVLRQFWNPTLGYVFLTFMSLLPFFLNIYFCASDKTIILKRFTTNILRFLSLLFLREFFSTSLKTSWVQKGVSCLLSILITFFFDMCFRYLKITGPEIYSKMI